MNQQWNGRETYRAGRLPPSGHGAPKKTLNDDLKRELLKLEGKTVPAVEKDTPAETPRRPTTQLGMVLSLYPKLPAIFTTDKVAEQLKLAGYTDFGGDIHAVRAVMQVGIKRAALERVPGKKRVYRFADDPKHLVLAKGKKKPSRYPIRDEPPKPVTNTAALERIERLLLIATAGLMVGPEDKAVIEDALMKTQAAAEANLKMVDLLNRMLEIAALRQQFADAMRLNNEVKA